MKNILRIGMLLCMFLLGSVGWAMAEEDEGGTGITTFNELKSEIESGNATEITLGDNITGANTTEPEEAAITINRALTLDGKGFTLSGSAAKAILKITGTGAVTIKNLTVANTVGNNDEELVRDIWVAQSTATDNQVTLDGVTLGGNGLVGLAIDGSKVTIKNVKENATHLQSAITLDKNRSASPETEPHLTIGEGNKFNCSLEINGLLEEEDLLSEWVNADNSGFVPFGMGYTDRFNSTTKTYTIPSKAEGRTDEINSYEFSMLARYLSNIEHIILGAGTFDLSALGGAFLINKTLTIEGAGSGEDETKIVGQIVLEKSEKVSEMTVQLNNLRMEAQLAGAEALVKINSANTHLVTDKSSFYQKCTAGGGVAIAFFGPDFDKDGRDCNNSTITLNNSSILVNATNNCRAISSYGGTTKSTGNKIKLVNSTIESTLDPKYAAYSRGVNFYKMDGASLEMDNSQIKGFAYGVNITDSNDNLRVNLINGSLVDSWTAFNIWSPNSTIIVTGSKLVSQNSSSYSADGSNGFSTVVFNERETITNNVITITDSEVSRFICNRQYPNSFFF